MNPTAKAFEHRRKVMDMTLQSNNKAQIGDSTMVEGKCWRCHQEGHHGRARAHIRKELCAAFYSVCQQCELIGHYTSLCKKGDKRA